MTPYTTADDLRALADKVEDQLADTERKAWDSLARYKFVMFAYHAAWWVKVNRLGGFGKPNPFLPLVKLAKDRNSQLTTKGR